MRYPWFTFLAIVGLAACAANSNAADCACGGPTWRDCTEQAACRPCEPACKSSWGEAKTNDPKYTLTCEPACARAAECFCTGPTECRCSPPCGSIYTKKKLYKQPGEEKVAKVPKYEVKMVPAEPCDCARCSGVCWWNPLSVLHYLVGR
jgi:hypothetical protein